MHVTWDGFLQQKLKSLRNTATDAHAFYVRRIPTTKIEISKEYCYIWTCMLRETDSFNKNWNLWEILLQMHMHVTWDGFLQQKLKSLRTTATNEHVCYVRRIPSIKIEISEKYCYKCTCMLRETNSYKNWNLWGLCYKCTCMLRETDSFNKNWNLWEILLQMHMHVMRDGVLQQKLNLLGILLQMHMRTRYQQLPLCSSKK